MKLTGTLRINSRTKEVKAQGAGFARDFVDILGEQTQELARRNVAPGYGPGPHPHRPGSTHIDTGNLMRSINYVVKDLGKEMRADVSTTVEYGLYLEMGWTSRGGNHFRYPWLYPAAVEASQLWANVGRSSAGRWFTDGGGMATRIGTPLSGTWQPEPGF